MAHRNLGAAVHSQAPLPPQGGSSAAAVGGNPRHVSRVAERRAAVSLQHMQAQIPPRRLYAEAATAFVYRCYTSDDARHGDWPAHTVYSA